MKIREESLRLERIKSEKKELNEEKVLSDGDSKVPVDKVTLELIKQGVTELEHALEKNLNNYEEELHEKINALERPAAGAKKK